MGTDNHLESLLFRYVRGTITDEEISRVERWIDTSPENRKMLKQLCAVDFASEAMQCMQQANPCFSLGQVKRKIRKNRFYRWTTWIQRTVAVLFIPLFCWTLYDMQRSEELKHEQPQIIRISSVPGVVTHFTSDFFINHLITTIMRCILLILVATEY